MTIDNPDPPEAETEPATVWREGRSKGAAQFIGVEGCHWAKGSVYFVASEGGDAEEGQIWRYTPHGHKTGTLVLLYESKSEKYLDEPDTITVSPARRRADLRGRQRRGRSGWRQLPPHPQPGG